MASVGHLALLFLALYGWPALGQTPCSVVEERRWRTISGKFSVGSTTATLTVPWRIAIGEPMGVFLEISGDESADREPELFIESLGDRVPVRNGATLHLAPKTGERIGFSLSTRAGEPLCTWQPAIRIVRGRPQLADGFAPAELLAFRRIGDPILLLAGGGLTSGPREFRIGGTPAMVLARTPWQFILRDPQPALGIRTLSSQGYQIPLRFVEIQKQLLAPHAGTRRTLEIRVRGLDRIKERPHLGLINFSQDRVRLMCGIRGRLFGLTDPDFDEVATVPFQKVDIREGEFTYSCELKVLRPGPIQIEVTAGEDPPYIGPRGRRF
jgi:hypothetical protein